MPNLAARLLREFKPGTDPWEMVDTFCIDVKEAGGDQFGPEERDELEAEIRRQIHEAASRK